MSLKQYMIILITLTGLIAFACVDVPATAPVLTELVKNASAKTDEVIDVKTIEENTEAKSSEITGQEYK